MVSIETRLVRLAEAVDGAWGACEFTETGGSDPVPAAWSGATNDGDRKRLAGSIVKLKSGPDKFGYLPASSAAALFRSGKIKLSLTGGESGNYLSTVEAGSSIASGWQSWLRRRQGRAGEEGRQPAGRQPKLWRARSLLYR